MTSRTTIAIILLLSINLYANAQGSVKMHEGVEIGGITQWIGAKSNDDAKPLLLFLHGGPGFSSRAYSKKFIKHLKKDFIVAQWDQRGTGITAAWNPNSDTLSLQLMHNDTEEVIRYLLKKFKKEKLYLAGFSWGGFLGLHFTNEHPELLHAYVSVSSMIHNNESERLTLELLHEKAGASNNAEALEELQKINVPFTTWEELYYQRKWTTYFFNNTTSDRKFPKSLFEEWSVKWLPIFLEASNVNYIQNIPEIQCPIYFFLSKNDFVSNYSVALQYFENLRAKQKQVVWFDEASHEIPSDDPRKFSNELIRISQQLN